MAEKSLLKKSIYTLIILFILLVAVFITLPYSLPLLIDYQLKKYGFIESQYNIKALTFSEFILTNIHLTNHTNSVHNLTINVNEIKVNFDIFDLIKGNIKTVTINDAKINIVSGAIENDHKNDEQTNDILLPSQLIPYIPLQNLNLNSLCIEWNKIPLKDNKLCIMVDIKNNNENKTLESRISLNDKDNHQLIIDATIDHSNNFYGVLFDDQSNKLVYFENAIEKKNNTLHFSGFLEIDLQKMSAIVTEWLSQPYAVADAILKPLKSGLATIVWQGTVPDRITRSVNLVENFNVEGDFKLFALSRYTQNDSFLNKYYIDLIGDFKLKKNQVTWQIYEDSVFETGIDFNTKRIPLKSWFDLTDQQSLILLFDTPLNGTMNLNNNFSNSFSPIKIIFNDSKNSSELSITDVQFNYKDDFNLQADFAFTGDIKKLTSHTFSANNFKWAFNGKVSQQEGKLNLMLKANSSFLADQLELAAFKMPSINIQVNEMSQWEYSFLDKTWHLQPLLLNLAIPTVAWDNNTIKNKNIDLTIAALSRNKDEYRVSGNISLNGLNGVIDSLSLPTMNSQASFTLINNQLDSKIKLNEINNKISIDSTISHNFTDGHGSLFANLNPILFKSNQDVLNQYFSVLDYPVTINNGTLSGDLSFNWPSLIVEAGLVLNDISGYYEDNIINKLNTSLNIQNTPVWQMPSPAKIRIKSLDIGFPINNIELQTQYKNEKKTNQHVIDIIELNAELLGGVAKAEQLHWNNQTEKQIFLFHFEHLDVSKIVELQKQDDLEATGKVSGTVPIVLTSDGVSVEDAKLIADRPGGIVRYKSDTIDLANIDENQMDFVMNVLKNFHYNYLDILLNYQPSGAVLLPLKFTGNNPDMGDYEINLNINLDTNLLNLLKSLKLSRQITDEIGKKYLPNN